MKRVQDKGHFKKNCSTAEQPKVVAEVASEEGVAAKESVATVTTAETVEMEEARKESPPASSGN